MSGLAISSAAACFSSPNIHSYMECVKLQQINYGSVSNIPEYITHIIYLYMYHTCGSKDQSAVLWYISDIALQGVVYNYLI